MAPDFKRVWWFVAAVACTGCEDDMAEAPAASPDSDAAAPTDIASEDGGEQGGLPADASEITVAGLTLPVEVALDNAGILHLRCENDADCFRAQGYFHARHRFAQMDVRRRLVRGQLAELAGPLALSNDITFRRLLSTREGEPIEQVLWDNASEPSRQALQAYADGVNEFLQHLDTQQYGAALADEYSFPLLADLTPRPWEPLDSIACVLALIENLTNSSDQEIARGEVAASLDAERFFDLFGRRPASPATVLPPLQGKVRTVPGDAGARMAAARSLFERVDAQYDPNFIQGRGSNNWIVSPSQSADGEALLANDPHLGLSNPAVWYILHMDARSAGTGQLHVAGASFAGLPGVILGQNENVAWGATNTAFDMADVYVEQLTDDGTGVVFNGETVPILQVQREFNVAGEAPSVETFEYVPHHGPIIARDEEAGTALSVRWTAHDADTDIEYLININLANDLAEAREAFSKVTTLGQNWVAVDVAGDSGWFPYNRLPRRPWASADLSSALPLPGDGSAEWGDPYELQDLPQAMNPPLLATANNDFTGALADGDPSNDDTPPQHFVAQGYRQERILQRLDAEAGAHTLATMQSIQADVYSLVGERVVPPLLAIMDGAADGLSDAGAAVLAALSAWDRQCYTGLQGTDPEGAFSTDPAETASAIGCAAFHSTFFELKDALIADELAAAGVTARANESVVIFQLTAPDELALSEGYWDDVSTTDVTESDTEIVARALEAAGAWLSATLGSDPDGWRWGRLHTITLRADLFSSLTEDFNNGPYARAGGMYTVDVGNPGNTAQRDFSQRAGASMRFACRAPSSGVRCSIELPGGNVHFRDAPQYDDQLQRYLRNEPVDIEFDINTALQNAAESYRLQPVL